MFTIDFECLVFTFDFDFDSLMLTFKFTFDFESSSLNFENSCWSHNRTMRLGVLH